MLFSTIFTAAAALISVASAATLPLKKGEFYLQTVSKNFHFNNLWLYAYHTGAGLNDAVLSPNSSYRIPASLLPNTKASHLVGGNLTFSLGTQFPWGPVFDYVPYAAFSPVQINAGGSTPGFSFSGNKLVYTNAPAGGSASSNTWGGWLVCNWYHPDIDNLNNPAPQLFWENSYNKGFHLPSNCAAVDLYKRTK